jgi:hypothetical protein
MSEAINLSGGLPRDASDVNTPSRTANNPSVVFWVGFLDSALMILSCMAFLKSLLIYNMKTRKLRLKYIRPSRTREKKWDAWFERPDGSVFRQPFGQKGYSDYTKHKNPARKELYISRHSRMGEDWSDPTRAGTLSRYILWNKKTLKASIQDFKRKFHL